MQNYDAPSHLEDYVHRCGRTGRAGNTGTAVTLLTEDQDRFAVHIEKALLQSGQEIPEDVKKLAETFKAKVTAGTEKWYDPGFGGKGLDKLDAARAQEKRREKRAHKGDFGDDESDSEAEALPTVVKNNADGAAADTSAAAAESDEPAYMKLLRGKIIVNKTERPAPESSKPKSALSAYEKAKAAAAGVDGRLGKKGAIHHGQPIDNKGPDAGLFHSTIEINDFPQKARWAVTNRTNVAKILEATGTSITTKGTHYAAGKQPGPEDLPPLYILVEGDTENSVTSAMMELTRLLRDGTLAAEEAGPRGATGRYSVV
jgi:ATP-dependent RNA helicase DDX46/PRP5